MRSADDPPPDPKPIDTQAIRELASYCPLNGCSDDGHADAAHKAQELMPALLTELDALRAVEKEKPAGWNVIFGNYFPREVIATFHTEAEAQAYVNSDEADDMWEIEPFYFDDLARLRTEGEKSHD